MQSRLAWLLAGFGIAAAALSRFLRTPAAPPPSPPPAAPTPEEPAVEPDPRADALAQRIAEAREIVDERGAFEEGETTPADAVDPESRRREVHERGRATLDRMRGNGRTD